MHSIATYTPYEALLVFQSVARHGADPNTFNDISTALNANESIREDATYDTNRLSAPALRGLYHDLVTAESNATNQTTNGTTQGNATNPRKRKLADSAEEQTTDRAESPNQVIVQTLVDDLYARYKEQVIKDIKKDEEEYMKIQLEIRDIEEKINDAPETVERNEQQVGTTRPTKSDHEEQVGNTGQSVYIDADQGISAAKSGSLRPSPAPQPIRESEDLTSSEGRTLNEAKPVDQGPTIPVQPQQSAARVDSPAGSIRSPAESFQNRHGQIPPPYTDQHPSPGAFPNRTLPPLSPQRSSYTPINAQPVYAHGTPPHPMPMLPHVPGMPAMPPPDYGPHRRPSSQGRGSPLPQYHQQPQYPGYPVYPPPHGPWPQPVPGQAPLQYQPYNNPQFYGQPQPGRPHPHMQHSPGPNQYQQYQHPTPPPQFKGQPQWQAAMGTPWNLYTGSASSTPVARSMDRTPVGGRSGSSTPWKKKPESVGTLRPSSPVRPERDVSPLTDRGSPAPGPADKEDDLSRRRATGKKREASESVRTNRRTRAGSTASSTKGLSSRSQSIASLTSDRQVGTVRGRTRKIKNEPPSTPAPFPPDSETQKPAGRRVHALLDTSTSHPTTASTASKRKRSFANYSSPTPSLPSPVFPPPIRRQHPSIEPSLVAVSKTFAKTANLLINEITAHKVASNFSKPLTEAVAPRYKSLILRPQDLKSIKAAVVKGGRAATAAIEELDNQQVTDGDIGEMPTPTKASSGVYLVRKTEDLIPPKGIVNSAQLEMELMRMFANAIMFNPLGTKERGLGPKLRLLRDGGEQEENEMAEEVEGSEADDGGIISDTREMCADISDLVAKFRSLEDDRLYAGLVGEEGPVKGAMASAMRAGSVSASVLSAADETAVEDGDATPVGTVRKRRKIAD